MSCEPIIDVFCVFTCLDITHSTQFTVNIDVLFIIIFIPDNPPKNNIFIYCCYYCYHLVVVLSSFHHKWWELLNWISKPPDLRRFSLHQWQRVWGSQGLLYASNFNKKVGQKKPKRNDRRILKDESFIRSAEVLEDSKCKLQIVCWEWDDSVWMKWVFELGETGMQVALESMRVSSSSSSPATNDMRFTIFFRRPGILHKIRHEDPSWGGATRNFPCYQKMRSHRSNSLITLNQV